MGIPYKSHLAGGDILPASLVMYGKTLGLANRKLKN
jgi:hypothetical protein